MARPKGAKQTKFIKIRVSDNFLLLLDTYFKEKDISTNNRSKFYRNAILKEASKHFRVSIDFFNDLMNEME